MSFYGSYVGFWLVQSSLGGTIIFILTWLLMRWIRQPASKQRVGEMGLIAALSVPVLSLLPSWIVIPVDLTEEKSGPSKQVRDNPLEVNNQSAQKQVSHFRDFQGPLEKQNSGSDEETKPSPEPAGEKGGDLAPAKTTSTTMGSFAHGFPWQQALLVIYAMVAAGLFIRLGLAFWQLHLLVRSAGFPPNQFSRLLEGLYPRRNIPRLLLSPRVKVPLSFGLFRPTILLPESMRSQEDSNQLRWILSHEIMHILRCDSWSGLLCGLAKSLFFFVPWCWWICREIRLCREYVADSAALQQDDQNVDYAEFLLSLTTSPEISAVASGVSGNHSDLYRRVTMLVEKPGNGKRRCSIWRLLPAGVGLLILSALFSGLGIQAVAQEKIIIQDVPKSVTIQTAPVNPFTIQPVPAKSVTIQTVPNFRVWVIPEPKEGATAKMIYLKKGSLPSQAQVDVSKVLPKNGKNKFIPLISTVVIQPDSYSLKAHGNKIVVQKHQPGWNELQKALKKLEKLEKGSNVDAIRKEIMDAVKKMNRGKWMALPKWRQYRWPSPGVDIDIKGHNQPKSLLHTGPYSPKGRLGISPEVPSPVLRDQLNLPKGIGLIIQEVIKNSPAGKAGFKTNDILLKLADQDVPSDLIKLAQIVGGIKGDKAVAAQVIRKGKRRTIKRIQLPEIKRVKVKVKAIKVHPRKIKVFPFPGGKEGTSISAFRTKNRFFTQFREGDLAISITGKVVDGKAKIGQITIRDGKKQIRESKIQDVPKHYQERLEHLMNMTNSTNSGLGKSDAKKDD